MPSKLSLAELLPQPRTATFRGLVHLQSSWVLSLPNPMFSHHECLHVFSALLRYLRGKGGYMSMSAEQACLGDWCLGITVAWFLYFIMLLAVLPPSPPCLSYITDIDIEPVPSMCPHCPAGHCIINWRCFMSVWFNSMVTQSYQALEMWLV